ncbi:hypothetical protein GCM10007874_59860 [Labrys miyagiensis]|uniref:SDR family oxidoreductase n=1 Tax=Labrys miyagiensis TaxID=346912 RepID=A0ABQ6CRH9_9HYPH|nr:SDR family oxidoreductase [Labrys miyagiensis]GLS22966.1 hypothetical protein GCM10007874_59860 [Labrys miyagiensis]
MSRINSRLQHGQISLSHHPYETHPAGGRKVVTLYDPNKKCKEELHTPNFSREALDFGSDVSGVWSFPNDRARIPGDLTERPLRNASRYIASKHAVEGLTKSGALEAAPFGVRVNAVAPGSVETWMLDRLTGSPDRKAGLLASIPLRRAGKPEELADAILFLASDNSSYVTGRIISVNGGRTAN